MTTDRRARANRVNAGLSTGPKSQDGKRASALNATKHGLSRARGRVQATDPAACEAAFLEVEHLARQALNRLALHLEASPSDADTLDHSRGIAEINAQISILMQLERYRTPRYRVWLRSLVGQLLETAVES